MISRIRIIVIMIFVIVLFFKFFFDEVIDVNKLKKIINFVWKYNYYLKLNYFIVC